MEHSAKLQSAVLAYQRPHESPPTNSACRFGRQITELAVTQTQPPLPTYLPTSQGYIMLHKMQSSSSLTCCVWRRCLRSAHGLLHILPLLKHTHTHTHTREVYTANKASYTTLQTAVKGAFAAWANPRSLFAFYSILSLTQFIPNS